MKSCIGFRPALPLLSISIGPVALPVAPLLLLGAALVMFGLTWLCKLALPSAWPQSKRWFVASVIAPSMFFMLLLLLSGPGWLQEQLGRLLLP